MINQFYYYKGIINYHRTDDLRPGSLPNGTEVLLQVLWMADEDERFAGQWIFQPSSGTGWLPQCDLIIESEITREEYNKSFQKRDQ